MIAKIAFLTSPAPNVYVFNYQEDGKDGLCQIEITQAHLANIVIDGASYALRRSSVPITPAENSNGHTAARA